MPQTSVSIGIELWQISVTYQNFKEAILVYLRELMNTNKQTGDLKALISHLVYFFKGS